MEKIGYIKLHRILLENALYKKPNYLAIWIDILLGVNHAQQERIFKGQKIIVGEGEGIFFQKEMADKFGLSTGSVSYILKYLKAENQIEIQTNNSFSIIKVTKWKEYQGIETEIETEMKPKGNRGETLKEGKNNKNEIIIGDLYSEYQNALTIGIEERTVTQHLLICFYDLGYKPSKEETIDTLHKWIVDISKLKNKSAIQMIDIITSWHAYWKGNKKEVKNHKASLLNNYALKGPKK